MTCTFPYDFGTRIFIPNRFMGKVKDVDEYEVCGYSFAIGSVVFIELSPTSFDGITIMRRVNDPRLYATEAEAREDKRFAEKGASD